MSGGEAPASGPRSRRPAPAPRRDGQHPPPVGPAHLLQGGGQDRRRPPPPLLQPPTGLSDGGRRHKARWRIADQQRHVVAQIGLGGLDRQPLVGVRRSQVPTAGVLAGAGVPADQSPRQRRPPRREQPRRHAPLPAWPARAPPPSPPAPPWSCPPAGASTRPASGASRATKRMPGHSCRAAPGRPARVAASARPAPGPPTPATPLQLPARPAA